MSKPLPLVGQSLAQVLMRGFYWVDESLQNAIRSRGWPAISRAQSMIFIQLAEGITRPSEMAERIGVSRQAIHQTLGELVSLGLLELLPDPEDKRAKVVTYTALGARLGRDALAALAQIESALACRLGGERLSHLKEALGAPWGDPLPGDARQGEA